VPHPSRAFCGRVGLASRTTTPVNVRQTCPIPEPARLHFITFSRHQRMKLFYGVVARTLTSHARSVGGWRVCEAILSSTMQPRPALKHTNQLRKPSPTTNAGSGVGRLVQPRPVDRKQQSGKSAANSVVCDPFDNGLTLYRFGSCDVALYESPTRHVSQSTT